MGVILRELASNAARHGALATKEGRIALTWGRAGDHVTPGWHEIGGPGAPKGAVNGYGLDLIAAQVEDQLHGKMAADFSRDGLVFELSFSLERRIISNGRSHPIQKHGFRCLPSPKRIRFSCAHSKCEGYVTFRIVRNGSLGGRPRRSDSLERRPPAPVHLNAKYLSDKASILWVNPISTT